MTSKLFKRVSNKLRQMNDKEDDNKVEGMAIFERLVNENHLFTVKSKDDYFNGIRDKRYEYIVLMQCMIAIWVVLRSQYLVFFSNELSNTLLSNPFIHIVRQDLANQTLILLAYIFVINGTVNHIYHILSYYK